MLIVVVGFRVSGKRTRSKLVIQLVAAATCTVIAVDADVIDAYAHVGGFECHGISLRGGAGISRKRAPAINVIVLVTINGAVVGIESHRPGGGGHEFNLPFLGNNDFVPVLGIGDVIRCAVA